MLSRERVTVFTQVSSQENIKLDPEFVFKGKETRTKVAVADNVNYQCSVSGSYRLEQMLKTISNLPNQFNSFTRKVFAIYVLDDNAVHLMAEIRKALYQRGYVLVLMGGRIAGYIQANDTDLHHHPKGHYRNKGMALMLKILEINKNKVPSPSREQMIEMLLGAWKETNVDFNTAFKKLFVTKTSDKLFSLIGDDMLEYRRQLLNSEVPGNLQTVVKKLIPPKGVRRKNIEGNELLDYMEGEPTIDDLESA